MATGLTAIAPYFLVTDVVRAAEYYRDKLGFTIRGQTRLSKFGNARLRREVFVPALAAWPAAQPRPAPPANVRQVVLI